MAAFVLSLREGLEAALIVGILLGALRRFGRGELGRFIWSGVAVAAVLSAAVAVGLVTAGIEMEGRAEQIFEGWHRRHQAPPPSVTAGWGAVLTCSENTSGRA